MAQCATFSNSPAIYWIQISLRNLEVKKNPKTLLSTPRLFRAAASKGLLQKETANNWEEGNPLKQRIMGWGYTGKTLGQETKTLTKKSWREEFSSWTGGSRAGFPSQLTPEGSGQISFPSSAEVCVLQQGMGGEGMLLVPSLTRTGTARPSLGWNPALPSQQQLHAFINTARISGVSVRAVDKIIEC